VPGILVMAALIQIDGVQHAWPTHCRDFIISSDHAKGQKLDRLPPQSSTARLKALANRGAK
jgi:hypothetical protein